MTPTATSLAAATAAAPAETAPAPASRPWWIPPILGPLPALEARTLTLLGCVALAYFFENYDLSLLMSALHHIAADLRIAESDLAAYTSLIRLGAIPAFFLVPFADRIGRRSIFLLAVAGISLATFATAFAQSIAQFVAIQMLARTFVLAASAMAFVIVAEEFPPAHRGWAMGMLGALGATGFGFGALLFAAVDVLPYGWRALYAVGLAPLLLLPLLARGIPETARFLQDKDARLAAASSATHGGLRGWLEPMVALARTFPTRFLGITIAGALYAAGEISVFQFCGYFTMTFHGWEPWRFSAMVITAGAVGVFGNTLAGRFSDQVGRRPIGLGIAVVFPFVAWLFYHAPGYALPVFWALLTLCSVSANVVIRSLATESFPTSHRGTAGGWLTLVQTAGTVSGLAALGVGTAQGIALPTMVGLLAGLAIIAGFALLLLPETSRLELEEISGTEHLEQARVR